MVDVLSSKAELSAEKAEGLPAFSGLKLLHVKRTVAEMLGLIGREGMFSEYTVHDISHIDHMLGMLDWLLPDASKPLLTPADWLMIVLAIYFHDLGMFVTRSEFEHRQESGFPAFRVRELLSGDSGQDYGAKIEVMGEEERERFLYQEFVRYHHAERVRHWIIGRAPTHFGIADSAMSEIVKVLEPLDDKFRRDLGFVCESHHRSDLDDLSKYNPWQPYGNSPAETVNLQYSAILLRTADLLHVTRDRTPSVAFRLINPANPVSRDEWRKQMAVTTVRSKIATDKDGNLDQTLPRDTIEIHALFRQPEGFFTLTSYLSYVRKQLQQNYDWVELSKKKCGVKLSFPWREIDESHIDAEGFLGRQFEFAIDQARILDLLTGHTLYNDTSVVVRELVQNGIDAVRVKGIEYAESGTSTYVGTVKIAWSSSDRVLSVQDNGTGMTQDIIERHLLKVGSSRYQDPAFTKRFPGFSAISRFGIGVLSAFMISDEIEIITCHPDEADARQLSLRSVHGKYLIRLLPKSDGPANLLTPHGTIIKLRVRPSAKLENISAIAERWVVVPQCSVTLSIDNQPEQTVGFENPADALLHYLGSLGVKAEHCAGVPPLDGTIRVEQSSSSGVILAYALIWSGIFKEWSILTIGRQERSLLPLGICVEGIRVSFDSPGFEGIHVAAIANVSGPGAPKTNVARSGLESTPERDRTLTALYRLYVERIAAEVMALHSQRPFSLTWAAQEGMYLLEAFLYSRETKLVDSRLFAAELSRVSLLLVEENGTRRTVPASELAARSCFWTVDSALIRSAEAILRELPGEGSLTALSKALNPSLLPIPDGPVLCQAIHDQTLEAETYGNKEVDTIIAVRHQRRLDLRWGMPNTPPRWIRLMTARGRIRPERTPTVYIGQGPVRVEGLSDEIAVRAFGVTFILPNNAVAKNLLPALDQTASLPDRQRLCAETLFASILVRALASGGRNEPEEVIASSIDEVERDTMFSARELEQVDVGALIPLLGQQIWMMFDPSTWARHPYTGVEW